MRKVIEVAYFVVCMAAGYAGVASAQGMPPGLAGFQMVAPEPERAGDRALSCAQITREMGLIMEKRNARQATATAKGKLCDSKQALDRQAEGAGDMMSVFNDPRLLRLSLLAQERQCAQSAPPPPQAKPADACEGNGEPLATSPIPRPPGKETSGPADPFATRGKSPPAAPTGSDPSVKPDPFARH